MKRRTNPKRAAEQALIAYTPICKPSRNLKNPLHRNVKVRVRPPKAILSQYYRPGIIDGVIVRVPVIVIARGQVRMPDTIRGKAVLTKKQRCKLRKQAKKEQHAKETRTSIEA